MPSLTAASMPLSPPRSPPRSPPQSPPRRKASRPLLPLPEAALFHNTNFLEECLFEPAFTNITSSLTSGLSTGSPAYVPTPAVISLAATISVHPNYTTRTADKDRHREAALAARFLRCVVDVVDGEAMLREAFAFKREEGRGNGRASRKRDSGIGGDGERALAGRYAGPQSLWACAADFWAVVGWAMNCSVRHAGRWERWRGLLEVVLDVLERDWARSVEAGEVKDCLLLKYLQTMGGGRNDRRRMMRAILADGSEKSVGEFGQVWREETRGPKAEDENLLRGKNKRKLDLENGEYGDYWDDDSANEHDNPTTSTSTRTCRTKAQKASSAGSSDASSSSTTHAPTGTIESFGGYHSLRLRQRLLSLLATCSHTSPKLFGADLSDLWSLYTEFLRPLPLPVFQQFISPQKAYWSPAWQASLCEMMSRSLLGISGSYGLVTPESFQRDIVSATANNSSVVDNAKVGVLVESLLRLLWMQGFLHDGCEGLPDGIEDGIAKREVKASGRKKGGGADDEARECLRLSGERLRVLGSLICG